jgi:hypothetical protein
MEKPAIIINGRVFRDALALELAPFVTLERALFVKQLRAQENSWRAVAAECAEVWHTNWPPYQHYGYMLCVLAATVLGEQENDDPW